jgi:hypothetical protein
MQLEFAKREILALDFRLAEEFPKIVSVCKLNIVAMRSQP